MSLFDGLRTINISEIEGIKIGNAQDFDGGTGCTVIIAPDGAVTGVDVRGGGPATRETDRLSPLCKLDYNHAVVISGGSAYGLDASSGVMEFLEEKGIGYKTKYDLVPLVAGASIYDLGVSSSKCRPDKKMGYEACENAFKEEELREGNYGVGTGATVGKFLGKERMMKSGMGTFAVEYDGLKIGALAVVNAIGDVYSMENGEFLAGLMNEENTEIIGTESIILGKLNVENDFYNENTTIGCIITNGVLTNAQATKISGMAQDGLARVIWPVHTSADGDSIFTLATGEVKADTDIIGSIASELMTVAINKAVKGADPAYGLKSAKDFGDK